MPLVCPACRKVFLNPKTDPQTNLEVDICPKCNGLWFDADELSKFFDSSTLVRRFYRSQEVEGLEATGYVISTKSRTCPRCHETMKDDLIGDVSVDICGACKGLWLDDGELVRIIEHHDRGGKGERQAAIEISDSISGKKPERPSLSDLIKIIINFFSKK